EPLGREVLPEDPVGQTPPELTLPPVELLAAEGVDRLVRTAVVPRVAHVVPDHPGPVPVAGSGSEDLQAGDGALVDPGGAARVPVRPGHTDVGRADAGGHGRQGMPRRAAPGRPAPTTAAGRFRG